MKRSLMKALAATIRARGLTQAELARRLGVSVPTVKRWLRGEGLDLDGLERLLAEAGLTLSELAALLPAREARSFGYTLEQERFFADHPRFLAYFDLLLAGEAPASIARKHGLSERSTARYLRQLEKLGLIERLPRDRVRLTVEGEPKWMPRGPLATRFRQEAIGAFLSEAGERVRFGMHRLTSADARKARTMLDELAAFLRAAEGRGKLQRDASSEQWGFLAGFAPYAWARLGSVGDLAT